MHGYGLETCHLQVIALEQILMKRRLRVDGVQTIPALWNSLHVLERHVDPDTYVEYKYLVCIALRNPCVDSEQPLAAVRLSCLRLLGSQAIGK